MPVSQPPETQAFLCPTRRGIMDKLSIDFETRSQIDLKVAGIYNYASSLDTEILMMGWAI